VFWCSDIICIVSLSRLRLLLCLHWPNSGEQTLLDCPSQVWVGLLTCCWRWLKFLDFYSLSQCCLCYCILLTCLFCFIQMSNHMVIRSIWKHSVSSIWATSCIYLIIYLAEISSAIATLKVDEHYLSLAFFFYYLFWSDPSFAVSWSLLYISQIHHFSCRIESRGVWRRSFQGGLALFII
jgi:hypothetical protein